MNKYFNPKTKKQEKLFETLNPVFTVKYQNPNFGNRNESTSITLEADDEDNAKIQAMNNQEFVNHIQGKYFDRKYLTAFKPTGLYVIGKVEYYKGQPLTP